jgi:hypothetical protein
MARSQTGTGGGVPRSQTELWDFQMVPERPVIKDELEELWVSRTEWLMPPPAVYQKYDRADPSNEIHWYCGG